MAVTRPAAVAGRWYPGIADVLAQEVDQYLASATAGGPDPSEWSAVTDLTALVAPHAGLRYSGPVAAYAYRELQGCALDLVVLVGPSHFVEFEGVAVTRADAFETPFGLVTVDEASVTALAAASALVCEHEAAHAREHSIEMQLPFLCRVCPHVPIVPLLLGRQTAETASELGRALAETFAGRRVMFIASTDLSHYNDAPIAAKLDEAVIERVTDIETIELGRHGLIVEHGSRRGLLLPQVAIEWGWTREQFLAHTCEKAGLRHDAWKSGAIIISRFEAEIVGP